MIHIQYFKFLLANTVSIKGAKLILHTFLIYALDEVRGQLPVTSFLGKELPVPNRRIVGPCRCYGGEEKNSSCLCRNQTWPFISLQSKQTNWKWTIKENFTSFQKLNYWTECFSFDASQSKHSTWTWDLNCMCIVFWLECHELQCRNTYWKLNLTKVQLL